MADDKLKNPVHVRAVSIKAVSLPVGFSPAYQQYVLSQAMDFTQVAGKANQAAGGAYDAQVRNDEQDVILADHEQRIEQAEATLVDHEGRITANTNAISLLTVRVTTAEGKIVTLQSDVSFLTGEVVNVQADIASLDSRVDTAESNIAAIQDDYVSKSATASQTISGPINVATSYSVNGTKVVGTRRTGWTAATGTAYRGEFNADTAWTIGLLNVLQIQAMADALTQARQRIKALEDDLRAHGLIN